MNTTALERWNKEQQIALDYQKIDKKESKHDLFISFVDLKRSFINEAANMVSWIKKEKRLCEDFYYFMDNGFIDHKPDRYKYRSSVFNDLKDMIINKKDHNPDVYEIVQKWDMWYHS